LVAAGRRSGGPRRLVNTLIGFGTVIILAALAPTQFAEEFILLLVGAGSVTFLSLANTTLQLGALPEMRGRVMSLWSVAFLGSTPIGGPIVGLIGNTFGARYSLGVGGAAALGAAGFGWWALYHRRPKDQAVASPPTEQPEAVSPTTMAPTTTAPTAMAPTTTAPTTTAPTHGPIAVRLEG
jgi:MFS family permease